MRGAVPCLSTDLTTHAVPHFIQALQMGRRAAPKALNDSARSVTSSTPRSRCGGGRGRGGDVFLGTCRRRRRRGGLGMRTAPKALNFRAKRDEFNSALTLRRRARARR